MNSFKHINVVLSVVSNGVTRVLCFFLLLLFFLSISFLIYNLYSKDLTITVVFDLIWHWNSRPPIRDRIFDFVGSFWMSSIVNVDFILWKLSDFIVPTLPIPHIYTSFEYLFYFNKKMKYWFKQNDKDIHISLRYTDVWDICRWNSY